MNQIIKKVQDFKQKVDLQKLRFTFLGHRIPFAVQNQNAKSFTLGIFFKSHKIFPRKQIG